MRYLLGIRSVLLRRSFSTVTYYLLAFFSKRPTISVKLAFLPVTSLMSLRCSKTMSIRRPASFSKRCNSVRSYSSLVIVFWKLRTTCFRTDAYKLADRSLIVSLKSSISCSTSCLFVVVILLLSWNDFSMEVCNYLCRRLASSILAANAVLSLRVFCCRLTINYFRPA